MKTYTFKVVVEPDEDSQGNAAWHAYCPALENVGAAASGRTVEEALKNINEIVLPRALAPGCARYGASCASPAPWPS